MNLKTEQIANDKEAIDFYLGKKYMEYHAFTHHYMAKYKANDEFLTNSGKEELYTILDLNIKDNNYIIEKYKEDIEEIFRWIGYIKSLDLNFLKKLREEYISKGNYPVRESKYNEFYLHQIHYIILFRELLDNGYFPVGHRIFVKDKYIKSNDEYVIYYV